MKISKALIAGITAPLLIAFLFPAPKTWAADCTQACLSVTVENGQIVVSGQKGNGPKSTKIVKVVKKVTAVKKAMPKKPVVKRSVLKQPSAVVATKKPAVKRKPAVRKKKVVDKKATPDT